MVKNGSGVFNRAKDFLFYFAAALSLIFSPQIFCVFKAWADDASPGLSLEIKPATENSRGVDAKGQANWLLLEPGLEYGEFRLNDNEAKLTALRINPDYFDFVLGCAGLDNSSPKTLESWGKELNLIAAINASMYLPDNRTSTGYMRFGDYLNNGKIMDRFGAFFVAGPRETGLPGADILDRDADNWRDLLDAYDVVVQNYRMINSQRRILWSPGGPLYAISAVARDGAGKILFLHCSTPAEAYGFVQQLLHLPLDIRAIMYVEGGAQAGMLINSATLKRELGAPHPPSLLVTGKLKSALPNIIGVRPKSGEKSLQEGDNRQN